MAKLKSVTLERAPGRENEYIIKDHIGITAGRVSIIEIVQENKYCTLRFKFYRNDATVMIKDALIILLSSLFNNKDVKKVNIYVDELLDIKAFSAIGFSLEGVLEESLLSNGVYRSELIFGISFKTFESNQRINVFRLRGRNIDLRVLTPENSDELLDYNIRNKEHLRIYEPARDDSFYTLEVQRKILIEEYKQYLNGTTLNCGIYKDSRLIGKIRLSNIVHGAFRSGFIGYSIDEKEQGRGHMKEAVELLVDYSFNEMDLHRVEASTLVSNIKSQRVLLGCEFVELGINRDYLFINGGWKDHITYYRTNKN